jgi:hypothetical protein
LSLFYLAAQPGDNPAGSSACFTSGCQRAKEECYLTQRIYRLNPSGIQEIRSYFDRFWDDALEPVGPVNAKSESFKAFIEIDQPKKEEPRHATNRRASRRPQDNRRGS